jgi:PadR family transcriptional regulator, regulatory protein AphA
MQEFKFTHTSYMVLGLIALSGSATPYNLKQAVSLWLGRIWLVPHSQLYAEPERLAKAGYLAAEREATGRRRKTYSLTEKGKAAFEEWRASVTDELPELRDISTLKIFFGAEPGPLAEAQLKAHREQLAEYETYLEQLGPYDPARGPRAPWNGLEAGIEWERAWIARWEGLLRGSR